MHHYLETATKPRAFDPMNTQLAADLDLDPSLYDAAYVISHLIESGIESVADISRSGKNRATFNAYMRNGMALADQARK